MKKLALFLLIILSIQSAIAQNTLDQLGLNSSTPSAVAYSLRKLSSTYLGYAIQVRRSNDNNTQDIGFNTSGDLDTTALKAFIGVNNGFITIWYDQSGNARDLMQPNTSKQPAIANGGVIYRRNGLPVVFHDEVDDGMLYSGSNYLTSSPLSVNIVASSNGNNISYRRAVQGTNNWLIGPYNNQHSWFAGGWNHQVSEPWSTTNLETFTVIEPATDPNSSFRNGIAQTVSNNKGVPNKIQTGVEGSYAEPLNGFINEILVFNTELNTTNRSDLENSQGTYYNISVASKASPAIGVLNDLDRALLDNNFTITNPTSNSTGTFTYASSNNAIASVNGNLVTLLGSGNTTITATQSQDANYNTGSVSFLLTVTAVSVVDKYGKISTSNGNYVNKNGAIASNKGLNSSGKIVSAKTLGDGLTSGTASTSAYSIKQAYPSSTDGLYWIANENINGGTPFQVYADMTTDGGGWTLIMCNTSSSGWTYNNAISLNTSSPSINSNYSIIGWADYIKKSASGFQYMIDATNRRSYGGIWTANGNYSFIKTDNSQTNITLNTKFGTWNYVNDNGISERMPWYQNDCGTITTDNGGGNWWGTLISVCGWSPTPWISDGGGGAADPNPGIIWYWVR